MRFSDQYVYVEFCYSQSRLTVSIRDDGKGFQPDELKKWLSLIIMGKMQEQNIMEWGCTFVKCFVRNKEDFFRYIIHRAEALA